MDNPVADMNTNNLDQGIVNARMLGDMLGEGLSEAGTKCLF